MQYPLEEQWHGHGDYRFMLLLPVAAEVERLYKAAQASGAAVAFPYWAKVWPAAIALTRFIAEHPAYVQHKRVLELAAGLGLPSMYAAFFAAQVICSDSAPDAVACMQRSIDANGFQNMQACMTDWNNIPSTIQPEVVLLSDINYEPAVFEELYKLLITFKKSQVTVILSTPQRLLAKPFIERLMPHCKAHVVMQAEGEDISVLVM